MNLWVKRTGQLLLAALFLISCEDDTYLLGFRDQKGKFKISYLEFEIGDGTVRADSVTTDNLSGTQRLLVGEYDDPEIGTITATAFTEFIPLSTTKLDTSATLSYKFDSLVFQMSLDHYSYGLVNEEDFKFKVHRITDADTMTYYSGSTDTTIISYNRYYATSTVDYDMGADLGVASPYKLTYVDGEKILTPTTLKLDDLEETDTIVMRTRLNQTFGQELFDIALNDVGNQFTNRKIFRTIYKGVALVPEQGEAIVGLGLGISLSRITMYYHSYLTDPNLAKDTLTSEFGFTGVSFHNISANRINGLPPAEKPYTGVDPGFKRVVECGSPLLTKIDLNNFYTQFADTISAEQKIELNSAEIIIESVPSQDGFEPISTFEMRIMKEDDSYADRRIEEDSAAVSGYNITSDGFATYYVGGDLTQTAAYLTYSKSKARYSGFPTLFIQTLLDNRGREPSSRPRYLGLYPATSMTGLITTSVGKSVHRSIFDKQNVKLRIYYTYPNKPNL